jgi:hypothetical protein
VSSTVEIDAPVETVFGYCDNPQWAEAAIQASASGRFSHISDVRRGPDGLVTTCKIITPIGLGRLHYDYKITMTRLETVPHQRIVERQSTGPLQTDTFEPTGTGTRYTHTMQYTTRFPLLDAVGKFLLTAGKGMQWTLDDGVAAVKTTLEADLANRPAQR